MRDNVKVKKTDRPVWQWQCKGNVLTCMLIILLFTACGEGDPSEASEIPEGIRMSREYAIERGIVTEEELYGVDFESMAEEYDWQEDPELDARMESRGESLDRLPVKYRDIRELFLKRKEFYLLPGYGFFDYSWLESSEEPDEEFTEKDIDQIIAIGFSYRSGPWYECLIYDFTENKSYWSQGTSLYRIGAEPDAEIILTEEQVEEVKDVIRRCCVYEWKQRYEGLTIDGYVTDMDFSWGLNYALEDGRVYSHSGSGIGDYTLEDGQFRFTSDDIYGDSIPDSYIDLRDGLFTLWMDRFSPEY